MAQQKTLIEASSFTPSTLVELYELDATSIGGPLFRFHNGTNNNFKTITFNSIEYLPFPAEATGFEYDGKGSLPRPKVRCANINGYISALLIENQNLIGAKFVRRRVFARFLDASNFPNNSNPFGTPDPTAAYPDEIFYVNRKVTENAILVEFELATPLELDEVKLPRRQILATICPFKYRDSESCGYAGTPIADKDNISFGSGGYGYTLVNQGAWSASTTYNQGDYVYITSTLAQTLGEQIYFVCKVNGTVGSTQHPSTDKSRWVADACSRRLVGCKLRFPNQALRFGGFPGVNRGPYVG